MKVKITPFTPNGEIVAPPSKSFAHRLLISASLKSGKTIIKNIGKSKDVIATINCLSSLCAKIEREGNDVIVYGMQKMEKSPTLDCKESGSTLRFLTCVANALGVNPIFKGSISLLSRPNEILIKELCRHGVNCEDYSFTGKLTSGKFVLDASVSSQYVSGLLFALPLLDGDSEIVLNGKIASEDYIKITLEVLEKSCIKYEKSGSSIIIKGKQQFNLPDEVTVEGDWSGSAFLFALGVLGGKVSVKGLNLNSCQGDRKILEILKSAGANVSEKDGIITAEKSKLKGIKVDVDDIPDLAPVICATCAKAEGESVISGIERLRIKESDRVKTILSVLEDAGVKAYEKDGCIVIIGGEIKGGTYATENDHRIVMMSAVLSAVATKKSAVLGRVLSEDVSTKSTILGYEATDKSYPDFWKDYFSLGGRVNVGL